MNNGDRGRDMPLLWSLKRHFRLHKIESVVIFTILMVGFLFYLFYGSWKASLTGMKEKSVEPMDLPADVVIYAPGWHDRLKHVPRAGPHQVNPDFLKERFFDHPKYKKAKDELGEDLAYPGCVKESISLAIKPALTEAGIRKIWTINEWYDHMPRLRRLFPTIRGKWPTSGEEDNWVVVHREFLTAANKKVGDQIALGFIRTLHESVTGNRGQRPEDIFRYDKISFEIVGAFDKKWDPTPQILLPARRKFHHFFQLLRRPRSMLLVWLNDTSSASNSGKSPPLPTYLDLIRDEEGRTRYPALMGYENPSFAFSSSTENAESLMFKPKPYLPFDMPIYNKIWRDGQIPGTVGALYKNMALILSPVALLIIAAIVLALTVTMAVIVADKQKTLGVYKVLGAKPRLLRKLYFCHILLLGLISSLIGAALFRPLMEHMMGIEASLVAVTVAAWAATLVFLGWWGGQAAAILFYSTEINSFLNKAYDFDWWSLLRFGRVRTEDR